MENISDLIEKLKSPSASVRYTAAHKLGKAGEKSAVEHLLEAIGDPDEMVMDNIIFALGELGDPIASAPLIKILRLSHSERQRKSAAKALGMLAAKDAVSALIGALKDPDFKVRKSAARSIGQIGDKKAIPALEEALQDSNFTVIKYVEDALDRLR